MNRHSNETLSIILGALTATSVGSIIFQALGVFILGLIGALAGWVFNKLIQPKLNTYIEKKEEKKAE